jgi:hypothetical protein
MSQNLSFMKKNLSNFSHNFTIFGIKIGIVYCKYYRKDRISGPIVGFVNEKRRKTFLFTKNLNTPGKLKAKLPLFYYTCSTRKKALKPNIHLRVFFYNFSAVFVHLLC